MEKFNILRAAVLLILTAVAVPLIAMHLNFHFSELQWQAIRNSFYIVLGFSAFCFITAELTGNCSQVDKLWSITPVVYGWYFAYANHFEQRHVLMAVCITIWGIRLTYNFSRRGAYRLKFWTGEEDYRWEVVRQNEIFKKHKFVWILFDLLFISLYQNILLWLITAPAIIAMDAAATPVGLADAGIALIMIGFIVFETIADQQQWNFQQEKQRKIKAGEPLTGIYAPGFITTGLWNYMRHPNYMAEQSIWITFYFFSVAATGQWLNISGLGALLLIALFQGSVSFSEGITASKYAAYSVYQKSTGKFLPKVF